MATVYELIAAAATGTAGYCVANFWMQPIIYYRKARQDTARELIVYANAISPGAGTGQAAQDRVQKRMAGQRERSADLTAAYVCLPWWYKRWLQAFGENPADAAGELLGLSNTTDWKDGAERMQKVQKLLRLPRIAA
ncbi:MAG: hypothetical protein NT154_34420 [Verrucomicrobia bacterium]|nr:hypothetical protein [Verrucomicrobiota bacterium]